MREFLERRVGMRREHFTVRVHVDAFAFGLLQDEFEVKQVVPGNENGLALDRLGVDPRRHGVAESLGFAFIEHFHDAVVELADVHRALEKRTGVRWLSAEEGHQFVEAASDLGIGLAEYARMLHVGSCPLQAIEAQQAQADHIFADFFLLTIQGELQGIGEHHRACVRQVVVRRLRQHVGRYAALGTGGFIVETQCIAIGFGTARKIDDALGIEVHVGQGRKEGLRDIGINLGIDHADLARGDSVSRHGLQEMHERILQVGDFASLATHAARVAAAGIALGSTDGVFTLHAKHEDSLVVAVEMESS